MGIIRWQNTEMIEWTGPLSDSGRGSEILHYVRISVQNSKPGQEEEVTDFLSGRLVFRIH